MVDSLTKWVVLLTVEVGIVVAVSLMFRSTIQTRNDLRVLVAEQQSLLDTYQRSETCLSLMVVPKQNWFDGQYLAIGEMEVCGLGVHTSKEVWGPSMEAEINRLKGLLKEGN